MVRIKPLVKGLLQKTTRPHVQQLLGFGPIVIRGLGIHYECIECFAVKVPRSCHVEVAALLNTFVGKFEPRSEVCPRKVCCLELM